MPRAGPEQEEWALAACDLPSTRGGGHSASQPPAREAPVSASPAKRTLHLRLNRHPGSSENGLLLLPPQFLVLSGGFDQLTSVRWELFSFPQVKYSLVSCRVAALCQLL